ncbi:hypothetical protein [Lentzea flaviverrucosa]|uniref:Uncharacterized protein n=1 Tax=Lentzea flaviverrucosa TaxID=200379 RepID=A0A1H9PBB3_9PSEU|nr:hypothetical protein [Lentzea flaviverrucosa]RDI29912.1 hypothetical protein DFR72_105332 [Lentzea flaviverrucosa]SER45461.1 hypothetical protein SAMN05216195_105240 [Lentzea flaviverrucosa]
MSGSLEVRKFLFTQDDSVSRQGGPNVPAQRNGEPSRISDEQVHRARLAVARGALGAEDCRMLLDMLGLSPGEDGGLPHAQR